MAENDLQQIPVQTPMVRPKPFDQFGDVQDRAALAILVKWGRRTGKDYIPDRDGKTHGFILAAA
ncbi:MAG: hypothetical protein E5W55_10855 [Mesorhizobium sp.]|nr:MAG: hypothetical protein E5W55_10855 [Mesorhizobium sp.]